LVLPEGHHINLDESEEKSPEDARAEERWSLGPIWTQTKFPGAGGDVPWNFQEIRKIVVLLGNLHIFYIVV